LPLLDTDATFVSLQKEARSADTATLKESAGIIHFRHELEGFSETAALISHLDLVISVDTAIAHLAGALGKPVWILLTHVPDWRWLLDRDDSPWYPTARLFRQSEAREWDSVITRVGDELLKFIGSR
jgi:ADP-heptose:LPS heptosyltransferase